MRLPSFPPRQNHLDNQLGAYSPEQLDEQRRIAEYARTGVYPEPITKIVPGSNELANDRGWDQQIDLEDWLVNTPEEMTLERAFREIDDLRERIEWLTRHLATKP